MTSRTRSANHISTQRYLVPILSNSLDIIELLQEDKAGLTLDEIHLRTGVAKSTAFRLLKTFVHRGYMTKADNGRYRLVNRPAKLRFGYASMCESMPFPAAVTEGFRKAAKVAGVDLLIRDNNLDPELAIANVEEFIADDIDLMIEFQADQQVAAYIAHRFTQASIPLIAVDIPHPRAIFFGVDNYQVGYEAGKLLAAYARSHWGGAVNIFLGLGIDQAGPLVGSRISAALRAVTDQLGNIPNLQIITQNSRGLSESSRRITSDVLEAHPNAKRILVATTSDSSALGVVQAVREKRRTKHVAIASQDCIPEAIEEMRRPDSPLIGSVSHQAQAYGPRLIQLGLRALKNEALAPYHFVEHQVVRREDLRATVKSPK